MKNGSRTDNSIKNSFWGIIYNFVNILGQFLVRSILVWKLGNEYVGLDSLYLSVLKILNFADLGIASAMSYSMYAAVAQNDFEKIGATAKYYKKINIIVGIIISVIGIIFSLFLKYFISGPVPDNINIYFFYYIYLVNSVVGYFMYSYEIAVVEAFQRNDFQSKALICSKGLLFCTQAIVLVVSGDYWLYVVAVPISTVVENIIRHIFFKGKYSNIHLEGKLDTESIESIKKRVIALFSHRVNGVLINSADTVVLTTFLGLEIAGLYSNYYYIFSAITVIVGIFYSSTRSSIGNSYILQSKEKNFNLFSNVLFWAKWIAGWFSICFFCLIQPFVELWVGSESLLELSTCLWISLMMYENIIISCVFNFKDAAGLWWEDRFRPYIVCIANIVLNIILVNVWGINGVVVSTVVTRVFISLPWATHVLFAKVFNRGIKKFIIDYIISFINYFVAGCGTYILCSGIPFGIMGFLARGIICIIIPNLFFYAIHRKKTEFQFWKNWFTKYMGKLSKN